MALPSSKAGTLRRTDERRLEAAEMRVLRYVAGYTLWGKGRSDEIRTHLRMRKTDKQMHERKKNWLPHLQRMLSERGSKQLYIMNRWEDVIQEDQEEDD
jgi:hypothetical protein